MFVKSFAREANDEENGRDVENEVRKRGVEHEPVPIRHHGGTRSLMNVAFTPASSQKSGTIVIPCNCGSGCAARVGAGMGGASYPRHPGQP